MRGSDALFWAWVLFSLLNVGYIVLQDLYIFPRTFGNYGEYRKTTPFLIDVYKRQVQVVSVIVTGV